MIFTTVFIVLIIVSTYLVLRRFAAAAFDSGIEMAAASVAVGFAAFAAAASLFEIILPTVVSALLGFFLIMICGAVSFFSLRFKKEKLWLADKTDSGGRIFYYVLDGVLSLVLTALVLNSFSVLPDGGWSLAYGARVDTPYHLAQVIRIGTVSQWDFEVPNFSGEFVRYPFFINFISGVLLKFGASLEFGFHFPAVLLVISMMILLVSFFRFLNFGKILLLAAVLGVLFGSGWGYIAYFQKIPGASLPIRNNMIYPVENISYGAMIPGFLIVQRAFLLGFPLFLVALSCFLRFVKKKNFSALLLSGIVAGLMPYSHTHSFIAIVIVAAGALGYLFLTRNEMFYDVTRGFVFPSFFIAIPQLATLLLLPRYVLDGMVSLRLGWMSMPGTVGGLSLPYSGASRFIPWLRFMWTNFGFFVFLPFAIAGYLRKYASDLIFIFLGIGALFCWIIPDIVQFQMWDFDTNKFFAYAIFLSLAAAGMLINFFPLRFKKIGAVIFTVIIIFSLPSSLLSSRSVLTNQEGERLIMLNAEERQVADWLRRNTDEDASVLSSAAVLDPRTIQNPVVVSSGRKTTLGFMTWIYTHGIDFQDRLDKTEAFFKNSVDKEILKDVPADYLLIDNVLREKYPALEREIVEAGYLVVYKTGLLAVIKLK